MMTTVQNKVIIDAPISSVWDIARNAEAFPEFMKDVESVEVMTRNNDTVLTKWVGRVPTFGIKVKWTQEDVWKESDYICIFKQIEGDYDSMDGVWKFSELDGKTVFESTLNYEYHIPGLGAIVNKVIEKLARDNMQSILEGIKLKSESLKINT